MDSQTHRHRGVVRVSQGLAADRVGHGPHSGRQRPGAVAGFAGDSGALGQGSAPLRHGAHHLPHEEQPGASPALGDPVSGRGCDVVIEDHHLHSFNALVVCFVDGEFGVHDVACVAGDQEQYAAAPVGRSDAVHDPPRAGGGEDRAGHVDVEEALSDPADHGRLVPGSVADHHADATLGLGGGADHHPVGEADDVGVCGGVALQHLCDRVGRVVEEQARADAHERCSRMNRAAPAASASRSS